MMTSKDLHYLGLLELGKLIQSRQVSPVDATQGQLDRIARLDGTLKSYAHLTAASALEQAHAAAKEIAGGNVRGPLHGVPIAVKDLCWMKDVPSAHGMTIYRDYRPKEDATVVARLKNAGAIILGKLQQTEGAYADHHPEIDAPKNPWNADLWSGASSSGSGVATAAGLCYGSPGPAPRRGPWLRLAGHRYWGIDPLSIGCQRGHGAEADMGARQSLWRIRIGGNAGSHWAHGAQCGRLRCDAWRDRRR